MGVGLGSNGLYAPHVYNIHTTFVCAWSVGPARIIVKNMIGRIIKYEFTWPAGIRVI